MNRLRSHVLPLLGIASTWTFASPALANVGAQPPLDVHANSQVAGTLGNGTPIQVTSEDLVIDCVEAKGELECHFEGVYHLENPTDERQEIIGEFYGPTPDRVSFWLGGQPLAGSLTKEEILALDQSVAKIDKEMTRLLWPEGAPSTDGAFAVTRSGFRAGLAAREHTALSFAGPLSRKSLENRREYSGYAISPVRTRHPFLGSVPMTDHWISFEYVIAPLRSWGGKPTVHLTIHYPSAWNLESGVSSEITEHSHASVVTATTDLDPETTGVLRLRFTLPRPPLNGGPLLAIGGRLGDRDLRLRAGYEIGFTSEILGSFSVERSDTKSWNLVPLAEVGSPYVIFIPSFAAGLGVPVQLRQRRSARVGARAQLTLSFPLLSLVVPFDIFPAGGDGFQTSMYAQASF